MAVAQGKNQGLRERLLRTGQTLLQAPAQRVQRADVRLHALSPTAVLQRGYALAFRADGNLLRSADEVHAGDEITTRLQSGVVRSRVLNTDSEPGKEAA